MSHNTWTKQRLAETVSSIRSGARLIGVKGTSWLPDGMLQDVVAAIVAKIDEKPTVDTTDTPANGEVLTYDSTSGKYKPSPSGSAPVSSVFTRTGAVASASGDYNAGQITNTPAGNIAATTVQAAINELDTEKATPSQIPAIASQSEADAGTNDAKIMTPLKSASASMLRINPTEVSVTGATTLTSTAFGKMHVCSGTSADYTVGLPAASGNAGKIIGFRMASALTKLVTLDGNASETIDAATTRVMWAQEVAILLCDGTDWTKIAGKTRPMIAAMRSAAAQTLSTSTETKLTFDTADVDTGALVSLASDNITIRRAATYTIVAQNTLVSGTATTRAYATVKVNGTYVLYDEVNANSSQFPVNSALTQYSLAAGNVLDLWGFHTTGADRDTASAVGGIHSQPKLSVEEKITW